MSSAVDDGDGRVILVMKKEEAQLLDAILNAIGGTSDVRRVLTRGQRSVRLQLEEALGDSFVLGPHDKTLWLDAPAVAYPGADHVKRLDERRVVDLSEFL